MVCYKFIRSRRCNRIASHWTNGATECEAHCPTRPLPNDHVAERRPNVRFLTAKARGERCQRFGLPSRIHTTNRARLSSQSKSRTTDRRQRYGESGTTLRAVLG